MWSWLRSDQSQTSRLYSVCPRTLHYGFIFTLFGWGSETTSENASILHFCEFDIELKNYHEFHNVLIFLNIIQRVSCASVSSWTDHLYVGFHIAVCCQFEQATQPAFRKFSFIIFCHLTLKYPWQNTQLCVCAFVCLVLVNTRIKPDPSSTRNLWPCGDMCEVLWGKQLTAKATT